MNPKYKNRPPNRQQRQRQQDEADSISLITFFLVIAIIGVSISIVIRSFAPQKNTVTVVEPAPVQDIQPEPTAIPDTNSPPMITDVILREDWSDTNKLVIYQDIHFVDVDGDAAQADFSLVETTAADVYVNDGIISERPEVQREGAIHTGTWTCHNGTHTVTLSVELVDQNDNRSNSETFTITCRN